MQTTVQPLTQRDASCGDASAAGDTPASETDAPDTVAAGPVAPASVAPVGLPLFPPKDADTETRRRWLATSPWPEVVFASAGAC